jgi:hypothetical protein
LFSASFLPSGGGECRVLPKAIVGNAVESLALSMASFAVLSGFGVPLGVVLALSTRLWRFPDLGVTLLPRAMAPLPATGVVAASSLVDCEAATEGVWVLLTVGVTMGAVLVAILGVRGVRFIDFAAAALSCGRGLSPGGILDAAGARRGVSDVRLDVVAVEAVNEGTFLL